jgi:hypothetical protein
MEKEYTCIKCQGEFDLFELGYLGPAMPTQECNPFMLIVPVCFECYELMKDEADDESID